MGGEQGKPTSAQAGQGAPATVPMHVQIGDQEGKEGHERVVAGLSGVEDQRHVAAGAQAD